MENTDRAIAALCDMVTQHCRSEKRGTAGKPCFLAYTHDFVSANEVALHVLEDCGEMERLPETAEWWREQWKSRPERT